MRLLLVGDDPRDALAIREALAQGGENGYRLEHAEGLSRGLDRVLSQPPDVLFLSMADGEGDDDGVRSLVALRRKAPDVPVVVLVRPGDEELAGLYNRRGFSVLAEQQMRLSRRWDIGLLLLVLDIDGLDAVNQRFGRAAGDRVLAETGQLLRDSFRDSDVKARVGGDEFAVMLAGAGEGTCEVIDQRLTQNLERLNALREPDDAISLSGGVARWDPASSEGVSEVLSHAEHLMHAQKRGLNSAKLVGGA